MAETLHNSNEPGRYNEIEAIFPTETDLHTRLTSAEIGSLWSQYLWDSMAVCFLQHFAENAVDAEIRTVIEYALELSQKHTGSIKEFFTKDDIPIPVGFTGKDVNAKAPPLFSDSLYLYYLSHMAKNGMSLYAQMLAMSTRPDIRSFYSNCFDTIRELDNKTREVLLSKGLYIGPPHISVQKEVDFVKRQGFLGSFFGSDRALHAMEISHLFFNMQRNSLGKAVLTGFSQVARAQDIRDYFLTGIEIAHKHIEVFSSLLEKGHLPAPIIWDTEVFESAAAPFSDKMMLYHTTFLTSVSSTFYGNAMGVSTRKDIIASYARLTAEVLKFAGQGAGIMINYGWMEEPPQAVDRAAPARKLH